MIPVPKRPSAPSSGTRQNIRRDLFRTALRMVNQKFWREPRAARRKIARAHAKAQWKRQGINP